MRYGSVWWLTLVFSLLSTLPAYGQNLTTINLPNQPVKVLCQSSSNNDDWLKDFSIAVENVSGRRILRLEAVLIIKPEALLEPLYLTLLYDQSPVRQVDGESVNHLPIGGKINLTLSDSEYQRARKALAQLPLSTIQSGELLIRRVEFGSGYGWYGGADYLRTLTANHQTAPPRDKLDHCTAAVTTKALNFAASLPAFGTQISEPIKIVHQTFSDGDDWLKDLEVEVENSSSHPIKYLELIVLICDIKGIDNCVAIPLTFPNSGAVEKDPDKPISIIMPGARAKLQMATNNYQIAHHLIEEYVRINTINVADLIIGQLYYADGGGWFNQTLLKNFSWDLYKSGNRAFLLSKEAYIWGYLRDRSRTYSDMYLGMESTHDDPLLEYIYDEEGHVKSVRVRGYVRRGGGYIRSNEKSSQQPQ